MKMKSFIFLFVLIATLKLNGQCLDTNTLLDSIPSFTIADLNYPSKLIHRRDREIKSKGDYYQALIIQKIFKNYFDTSRILDKDSTFACI